MARQPSEPAAKQMARDLVDGDAVNSVFEVREISRRQKKNGDPFLKLQLGDATSQVEAICWDEVAEVAEVAEMGAVLRVAGSFSDDPRYGRSMTLRSIPRLAREDEFDPAEVHLSAPVPYAQMAADLEELIGTIQQPHLRELLESLLCRGEVAERWRSAPAAKVYHQAYRSGLLEHSLSVAQGVSALAATFPGIDRDVAVSGALLHDIGKIDSYETSGGAIDLSDSGRLQGEIPLGYFRVRQAVEQVERFPPDLAEALLHIILSHHGKLEHGSPVVPCTREAALVHMIDDLGGTLGSFDRIEKSLPEGERWSHFDRAISGAAYFAPRVAA